MHPSVMQFLCEKVGVEEIQGLDVIEVGSQDVNGTPRQAIIPHGPRKYVGVDFEHGKGVDLVMDVKDITSYFGVESFDAVVSTEMLEHAPDWRVAVDQMKDVLRPKGILLLTTRSPGFPYHGFPHDYWRFTIQDFKEIFSDMEILHLDLDPYPNSPGVFLKARKVYETGVVDLAGIDVAPVQR